VEIPSTYCFGCWWGRSSRNLKSAVKKSIQFTDGCPPEFLMPVELTQMLIEYCPVVLLLVSFAYDSHPFYVNIYSFCMYISFD
jgi:hypothetical protein